MSASEYYEVENVPLPAGIEGKVDALAFMPDGRLAVGSLEGGRVTLYDPESGEWQLFAEGLHEPMGMYAPADTSRELVAMQRPELTRLRDTNNDGFVDRYDTISDDFGLSGNYDEFGNGVAVDGEGNYYVSLSTAYGGPENEVRGELREDGLRFVRESAVPYRGWVMRIGPDGETTPWASGFRAPNGIANDDEGRVFVTDQQGEWVGTSPLHHIQEGNFYGFPSALIWDDTVDGYVPDMSANELDAMRTRPTVQFPHGEVGIAPTGLAQDTTEGGFGPFAGQLFVADFAFPHVVRVLLDEVAGELQGACVKSAVHGGRGGHRVVFGPDGDLWVGFTGRETNWQGGRGLKRVSWTGQTPFEVEGMTLTEDGFDLRFTKSVDAGTAGSTDPYAVTRYYYNYSREYGSDKHDVTDVSVTDATVSDDGRGVSLTLSELQPGYVHAMSVGGVQSDEGDSVLNPDLYYTLNRLRDGSTGNPQFD